MGDWCLWITPYVKAGKSEWQPLASHLLVGVLEAILWHVVVRGVSDPY